MASRRRRRLRPLVIGTLVASTTGCARQSIPPEAVRHQNEGLELLSQGECVRAQERCQLALEYGRRFQHPHNCLGLVALQCTGDLDDAARHFKDAIAIDAAFAEAHNNLGTTLLRREPPDYQSACDEFQAALEIDPGYTTARENLGLCLIRRGALARQTGDLEGSAEFFSLARSHLIRLSELAPDNANAHHHLGFIALTEERNQPAESHLARCLEIDPEHAYCSYHLGYVFLRTARCDQAIAAFIAALRGSDRSGVAMGARQNLGVAYEQCALEDEVVRAFLDRIKEDPADPSAHFDLGVLYADKGLHRRAREEWSAALELDGTFCASHHRIALSRRRSEDVSGAIAACEQFLSCTTRSGPQVEWRTAVLECREIVGGGDR